MRASERKRETSFKIVIVVTPIYHATAKLKHISVCFDASQKKKKGKENAHVAKLSSYHSSSPKLMRTYIFPNATQTEHIHIHTLTHIL